MNALAAFRQRWLTRFRGRLAGSVLLSELVGRAQLWRARYGHLDAASTLRALVIACRRINSAAAREQLRATLAPYLVTERAEVWRSKQIGWSRFLGSFGDIRHNRALNATLLIKAPGLNGEKGVIYSSFEYNWMRLVVNHDARALLNDYYLVGASSWSPTDYAALGNFAGLSDDPLFIGISNVADLDAYKVMRPVVEAVPLMACDWINPDYYTPKPRSERTIDLLMVANWLPFKRHWLLFEALRKMPRNLRVVLVGRNAPGRTESEIRDEARAFGVRQDLELITNVDINQVTALQCDARVSLVCSQREGSCVAPAESLFADTPIALMEDAHVGVKAHVNEQTGILLSRARMARQLSEMLEQGDRFSPREWAVQNISCHRSSAVLNAQLRAHSLARGRPWTVDIAPLCWRYVPSYVYDEDDSRLAHATTELYRKHGVELVRYRNAAAP